MSTDAVESRASLLSGLAAVFRLPSGYDHDKKSMVALVIALLESRPSSLNEQERVRWLKVWRILNNCVVPPLDAAIRARGHAAAGAVGRPTYGLFMIAVDCVMAVAFLAVSLGCGSLHDYTRRDDSWLVEENKQLRQLPILYLARISTAGLCDLVPNFDDCRHLCLLALVDPAVLDADLTHAFRLVMAQSGAPMSHLTITTTPGEINYTGRLLMLKTMLAERRRIFARFAPCSCDYFSAVLIIVEMVGCH